MGSVPAAMFGVTLAPGSEKCQRIVAGIIAAIRDGRIRRGEGLPTVESWCRECGFAKETVIKAYAMLRERGVVVSVPRKGYFVATESVDHQANVMLLFDELSPYKQVLYDHLVGSLGGHAQVDVYFHHCTPAHFAAMLLDNLPHYDLAVVMPFAAPAVTQVLEQVDAAKVLILDRRECAGDRFSFVGQEFERSVAACLQSAADLLVKYRRLVLLFPRPADVAIHSSQAPAEIVTGFRRFARAASTPHTVLHGVDDLALRSGDAVLVIDDADLVGVVEMARTAGLRIGKDVGIVSYNDAPMKRVIDRGITVISTDFSAMGRRAAAFVRDRKPVDEVIPTTLIRRHSL